MKKLAAELFAAYTFCFLLTGLDVLCMPMGSPIADIAWLAAISSLLFIPVLAEKKRTPLPHSEHTPCPGFSSRNILAAIAIAAAISVPITLGNHIFRTEILGLKCHFAWQNFSRLGTPFFIEIVMQIFCVALPEEFFFRNYLQTEIENIAKSIPRLKRIAPAFAITTAAAAFACIHLPSGGPIRLLTFFPGLLFGFLRFKTQNLAAPIIVHATCNLLMIALNIHYFP